MCMLYLHYTLNGKLISHINHHYLPLCLALYGEASLGCSGDNRGEISQGSAVYRFSPF